MDEKVGRTGRTLPGTVERDPSPWGQVERIAIIGIFTLLLAGALIYGRPILVPIASALIFGALIGATVDALTKRGVPTVIASATITIVLLGLLYGLVAAFSVPLSTWIGRAPEIGAVLKDRFAILRAPLDQLRTIEESLSSLVTNGEAALTVSTSASLMESVITFATPAFSQLLVFAGTLIFFLASRLELKRKLVTTFETREGRLTALRVLADIERGLGRYLGTVTIINIGLGLLTALAMLMIGMPNPGLWGLLTFVMNYVPFIGPAIVTLVLFAVGIMSYTTLSGALLPPAAFLVLHTIESQFVTPNILGRRLTLNPFIVFVALSFWAWIWGPVGAFLAVPILVTGFVIFDHTRERDEIKLPG